MAVECREVCQHGCHWVCVSNKFSLEGNTFQVYDSLMTVTNDKTIEQLCTILSVVMLRLRFKS